MMFVPMIPPKNRRRHAKKTSPGEAMAGLIVGLSVMLLAGIAIAMKKGIGLGLVEVTMIGAIVVLMFGGALIAHHRWNDQRHDRRPKRSDHEPID